MLRVAVLAMCVLLILGLAGCSNGSNPNNTPQSGSNNTSQSGSNNTPQEQIPAGFVKVTGDTVTGKGAMECFETVTRLQ
ncbi:MAG: hypothetical protein K5751_09840 [Treponemataceae bacterium]|nr:hypothetical protein [Treponemataceae bacterium]